MDIISLITAILELLVKLTGNKSLAENLQKKWAIYSNLPRLSVGFVGRSDVKKEIHHALLGKYPLVSLEGPGGVGKSRLALQVADECWRASCWRIWNPFRARFGAFIWASDENQALTLGNLLDIIALTLQETTLSQLVLEQKRHQVLLAMQKKPCLLVVDNFETITEKQQIVCWSSNGWKMPMMECTTETRNTLREPEKSPVNSASPWGFCFLHILRNAAFAKYPLFL